MRERTGFPGRQVCCGKEAEADSAYDQKEEDHNQKFDEEQARTHSGIFFHEITGRAHTARGSLLSKGMENRYKASKTHQSGHSQEISGMYMPGNYKYQYCIKTVEQQKRLQIIFSFHTKYVR